MQKRKTHLTTSDILFVVEGLNDTFPKCSLKDIETDEEWLFNCKLGKEFKKELDAALCDETCIPYDPKEITPAGTVVIYNGVRKIALVDTDSIPATLGEWENAPKYCGDNADCLNYFWCNYLRIYLAWYVMATKSNSMGSSFNDNGSHVRTYNSSTSIPADSKDLARKTRYYKTKYEMAWDNMVAYAKGKKCLSNFCKFEVKKCAPKTRRNRQNKWN